MASYRRNPRRLAYLPAYLGHAAQGFIAAQLPLLGPTLWAWGGPAEWCLLLAIAGGAVGLLAMGLFACYQVSEFARFTVRAWRQGIERVIDDWPSRDISDALAGVWLAVAANTAAIVVGVLV